MDPSLQAEALTGASRGAVIGAMAGAGWLGWGLGNAKAYNGFVAPAFGFTALFLLACSVYFLREGRRFRKQFPRQPSRQLPPHGSHRLELLPEAKDPCAVLYREVTI